jgi:hypothetical protein
MGLSAFNRARERAAKEKAAAAEAKAKAEAEKLGKFAGMDAEALKAYAAEKEIDIGNATSVNGIIKKITEAEK